MRILVADDHDLVRETIAAFLEKEQRVIVTQVATLDQALAEINKAGTFDLALLDYTMPGMNGLSGFERVMAANGGNPVALISGTANKDVAEKALKLGAAGFLPKTMSAKSMVNAVRFMAMGEIYAPLDFMTAEEEINATSNLTPREIQVLKGLCDGKANKEIARDNDLQEVTIKLHVKNLCRKLGARNRTHAAMIGRDRQLI
ncbi:response regulator [Thalassovita taeanensis]|uniref:Two component transcriptional regulator, LuxR family n=1 Tax=Thalassovita taeanensis TaxID=657014 RepID=A0A1H9ED96_9RHOB|nr:response regulator transcription factor [Thalassovita taeanensis]SEQ23690.1 two component transcriptional regulator, LuxR family [Thalassovita taeanensis]